MLVSLKFDVFRYQSCIWGVATIFNFVFYMFILFLLRFRRAWQFEVPGGLGSLRFRRAWKLNEGSLVSK